MDSFLYEEWLSWLGLFSLEKGCCTTEVCKTSVERMTGVGLLVVSSNIKYLGRQKASSRFQNVGKMCWFLQQAVDMGKVLPRMLDLQQFEGLDRTKNAYQFKSAR